MRPERWGLQIVAHLVTYDLQVLEKGQKTDNIGDLLWICWGIYRKGLRILEEETNTRPPIPPHTSNHTMFENNQNQSQLFTTTSATSPTQATRRVSARCPGEFAGSRNILVHAAGLVGDLNLITPKMCIQVHRTHGLETRQHCLSV